MGRRGSRRLAPRRRGGSLGIGGTPTPAGGPAAAGGGGWEEELGQNPWVRGGKLAESEELGRVETFFQPSKRWKRAGRQRFGYANPPKCCSRVGVVPPYLMRTPKESDSLVRMFPPKF